MKLFILLSFISFSVMAAESKTECPWMRESLKRSNPKSQMEFDKGRTSASAKSSKAIRQ